MRNNTIYGKTPKGEDPGETASDRLLPHFRRFLILVDGRRSVNELSTVARPDELNGILAYLTEQGYIVKVGMARDQEVFAKDEDPFSEVALTPDMFVEFKRRAIQRITERFGASASQASILIEAAATPGALRSALRESEGIMTSQVPGDAAEVRK